MPVEETNTSHLCVYIYQHLSKGEAVLEQSGEAPSDLAKNIKPFF